MILQRYIGREILGSTTAISLVLLLIFLSGRFVKYLAEAAAGYLDTGILFFLILYRIPDFLQLILPLGLFIGLLLVYARLHLDNEMRIFFSAGISRLHLLVLTLLPVLVIAGITGLISLWFSPLCLGKVEHMVDLQDQRSELDTLREGQFQVFRNNRGVIYAEHIEDVTPEHPDETPANVLSSRQLQNVYIFQQDADTHYSHAVIVADTGKQMDDERGRYLVLEHGYRWCKLRMNHQIENTHFVSYAQRVEEDGHSEFANIQLDAMPSAQLQGSPRADYQAMWQWRLSLMFMVPVIALLAVALGKADPRQGRYLKLLPAIFLYLVYVVLLSIARDKLIKGELSPTLGLWWVHGLFVWIGILIFNAERLQGWIRSSLHRERTTRSLSS